MIKVNLQIKENPAEITAENFPRLFRGGEQVQRFSCVYDENGIDIQHTVDDDELFIALVNLWIEREERALTLQLAETQRKLAIIKNVKGA